jgi:hypothetical protein
MQVIIKASGQRRPDSGDLFEIGHASAQHTLQASEVFQQSASLRRPQARDRLEY